MPRTKASRENHLRHPEHVGATVVEKEASAEFIAHALSETEACEALCRDLTDKIPRAHTEPLFIESLETSLTLNHNAYKNSKYCAADVPDDIPLNKTLIRDIRYGYNIDGEKRRVGLLLGALINNETGEIEEIYAPSKDAFDEFLNHIQTRIVTDDPFKTDPQLSRIIEINNSLVRDLREHVQFREKLDAFIAGREFEPQWGEQAQLAYFNADSEFDFDLRSWALLNNFTLEEMYLAGWMEKSISNAGEISYSPSYSDVCVIPFFNDDGDIISWRLRVLNPKPGDPKYRDQPRRREYSFDIEVSSQVQREMHNAPALNHLTGEKLFITEGEFKGLVTEQITGVACTCITGITLISDAMIDAWVAASPDEIVICLDRDPLLMSLERIDGIPDSQRAAYLLAQRLIRAGAKNVRIAELPDILYGEKVGIDDFLLHDKATAQERFHQVLRTARTVSEFEEHFNVDTTLQKLYERRSLLKTTKEKILRTIDRGYGDEIQSIALDTLLLQTSCIESAYEQHLALHYSGARSISRPHPALMPLAGVGSIQGDKIKSVVDDNGDAIPHSRLTAPIATLTVLPVDAKHMGQDRESRGKKGKLGVMSRRIKGHDPSLPADPIGTHSLAEIMDGALHAPVQWRKLRRVWSECHGDPSGKRVAPRASFEEVGLKVHRDFIDGVRIAFPNLAELSPEDVAKRLSYRDFCLAYFTGFISRIAPPDTYNFHTNVRFNLHREDFIDVVATAPIALTSKKSGMLKAIIYFPVWREGQNIKNAMWEMATTRGAVRAFLREPSLNTQRDHYSDMAKIFWEVLGNERVKKTHLFLSHLGINETTIRQRQLTVIFPSDWPLLEQHFIRAGTILDAFHAGFYLLNDKGEIRPRYTAPLIIAPHRDTEGHTRSFLSIPLSYEAVAESPHQGHPVGFISSGQNLATAIDPYGRFFGDDKLTKPDNKERPVYIAQDPLDMLILQSLSYEDTKFQDAIYLSANGSLSIRDRAFRNVLKQAQNDIVFLAHPRGSSPYDLLTPFDAIPSLYRELIDIDVRFEKQAAELKLSGIRLKAVILDDSIARLKTSMIADFAYSEKYRIHDATPIAVLAQNAGVDVKLHKETIYPFFRMLGQLDVFIDSGKGADIPGWSDIGSFARDLRKHYRRLTKVQRYHSLPSLNTILAERYNLADSTTLEDILTHKVSRDFTLLPLRDSRKEGSALVGNVGSYMDAVIVPRSGTRIRV